MTDYKNTLNLPHTDFPMKANLAQREPEFLQRWQQQAIYSQLRQLRQGKPKFILHDGPPYANGNLHIGHAVNKILKDIIVKAKSMDGLDAPYVPGWDCHGLPIELNVEKKIGKAGVKVPVADFRKACREYALQQVNIQREEFKRLGVFGDWDNPYLTMNFKYEANIIRALAKIIANDHLQQGYKPVHWCMDCGSALAEAEVEYQDKTSSAIDVRFVVIDESALASCFKTTEQSQLKTSIPIWTTTPWTLPANRAVTLHPEYNYVLVEVNTAAVVERLIIVEPLLDVVLQRYGITEHNVVARCQGAALEGLKLHHPFYELIVPVILGEHVTLDAGTGAVHTAPGHGQDDYQVGLRYQLEIANPVGPNGCFLPDTPLFAGLHVLKVNPQIIEVLTKKSALLYATQIQHSYPHCWRHKTPVIFRATPQWFISMDKKALRSDSLQAIRNTQWIPAWGEERIHGMIEGRPDWCISRQRTWGVPIAIFVDHRSGELHPRTAELMEQVAQKVEQQGIDAWFDLDPKELLGDQAGDYFKVMDTLDVWFDSGVSHYSVLEHDPALSSPADLYLEGSDQHRGWFHSSLLTSIAIHGRAPYRNVLTHGFAVDAKGRKMSKSLGNVIAPEKVINSLGADVLRLWVASADYRAEITVSDEILKRTSDTYRRLRNTARFLLANLNGFEPAQHQLAFNELLELDQWIVDQAISLQANIKAAYNDYQFHLIYHLVHNFCSVDLGSFYLDIIKDRQYTTTENSKARRSAQSAMYHVAEYLVRWLAPILSFTAEELWQFLPGQREASVFLTTWYRDSLNAEEVLSQQLRDKWQQLIGIRNEVNKELEKQRAANQLGAGLEAEVELYVTPELQALLASLADELRFVLITSTARIHSQQQRPTDAVATELPGLWLKVQASSHPKCVRCWHRREDVGQDAEHPEICGRCVENVAGQGEERKFA